MPDRPLSGPSARAVAFERQPCGVSCPAGQSPENVPNKGPVPNWKNIGSFWEHCERTQPMKDIERSRSASKRRTWG